MGHGNHWGAVLENLDEDFARVLNVGITKGDVVGRRRYPRWQGPTNVGEAEITLIQSAKNSFCSLGIIVANGSSRNYLHSAFPVVTSRQTHSIRVLSVKESSFGLEAWITVEIGEVKITFFEPHYALNFDSYAPGTTLDVSLAGIAYQIEVPDSNQQVAHPDLGEIQLQGAAMFSPMARTDF